MAPFLILLLINTLSMLVVFGFKLKLNMSSPLTDVSIFNSSFLDSLRYSLPTMNVCLGTPVPQCFNLCPNTMHQYTILGKSDFKKNYFNHSFKPFLSDSFIDLNHQLYYHFSYFKFGCLSKDYLTIPGITPVSQNKIDFLLVDTYKKPFLPLSIDGFIGFGKYYDPFSVFYLNGSNFIEYLYNSTTISKQTFALNYTHNGGELVIGEDFGNYAKCHSKKREINEPNWNCQLNQLIIGDHTIDLIDNDIVFDSVSSLIQLPNNMKITLIENIIYPLTSGSCYLKEDANYHITICKEKSSIKHLPSLILKINNGVEIIINWDNLFQVTEYKGQDVYISTLVISQERSSWIVGYPGFIGNTIIFDREDYSIGIIRTKTEKIVWKQSPKTLLIIINVLLLGWSCLLVFIFQKQRLVIK